MIEVQTFGGDPREAAAFTTSIWTESYGGHHEFPLWDERYFQWQLFGPENPDRSLAVAAYDSGVLAGTFFAEQFSFSFQGQDWEGSMSSWITVDPRHRGQGVGRKMADEMRRRHRERNLAFSIGFGISGTDGPKFWNTLPDTLTLGKVGFWARVLDRSAVAAFLASGSERAAIAILGPFVEPLSPDREFPGVRPYRPEDLDRCLELTGALTRGADLGYRWTSARLAHQLDYRDTPQTLVFVRDGIVQGFINYYVMDFLLRTSIPIAQVDVMACGALDRGEAGTLIGAALRRMKDDGVALAMVPRIVGSPTRALLRHRFVPLPAELLVISVLRDERLARRRLRRFHLHLR